VLPFPKGELPKPRLRETGGEKTDANEIYRITQLIRLVMNFPMRRLLIPEIKKILDLDLEK